MAYPDIVSLLRAYLLPIVGPGVPITSRVPDPRPKRWLQIRRVGGPHQPPVRDRPRVDVIAWAQSDPEAWALAEQARRAIHALKGTALLGPVVYRVDETLGPAQVDDPQTSLPRVMATFSITVRADDAIAR